MQRANMFLSLLAISPMIFAQTAAKTDPLPSAYTQTVQRVVAARTEVVGAATQLKAACEKKKEDCAAAALAYNKAKGQYDGWISVMKLAIKQGKARNLKVNDPDYKA